MCVEWSKIDGYIHNRNALVLLGEVRLLNYFDLEFYRCTFVGGQYREILKKKETV